MPGRKRAASNSALESLEPRRSSRRISTVKTSKYFESDSEEDRGAKKVVSTPSGQTKKGRGRPPGSSAKRSARVENKVEDDDEDEDAFKDEEEEESDDGEDYNDEEGGGGGNGGAEEPEDDDDDDDDEDRHVGSRVKIIPIDPMRDTGGVDYADEIVHKNTLLFLKDLKKNNKRPWLKCKNHALFSRGISLLILSSGGSTRRGVQEISKRLAVFYRDNDGQDNRDGRGDTGTAAQRCDFSDSQRHSVQ